MWMLSKIQSYYNGFFLRVHTRFERGLSFRVIRKAVFWGFVYIHTCKTPWSNATLAYCALRLYKMGEVSWRLEESNVMRSDHVILLSCKNATSCNFVGFIFIDTCSSNGKVFRMRLIIFCCQCRKKKITETQDFGSIQGRQLVKYTTIKEKGLLGQKSGWHGHLWIKITSVLLSL